MFNLEKEVENFVISKVKEIIKDKHTFSFRGGDRTFLCKIQEPHIPHVIYHYQTVRYRTLEGFCLGKEGEIEINGKKKKLVIVIERYSQGDAETPTYVKGFYFFV